jgi:hypothetical protein
MMPERSLGPVDGSGVFSLGWGTARSHASSIAGKPSVNDKFPFGRN